jgi:hypothetical protein
MLRRSPLLAAVVLACCLVSQSPARPDPAPQEWGTDYFPLVSGAEYNYKGVFEGKVYPKPVAVRTHQMGKTTGFYFVDFNEKGEASPIIGPNGFGLGHYRYEDGKLLSDRAFREQDLKTIDPKETQTLLSFPLRRGDRTMVRDGDKVLTLTVVGVEAVQVPAGNFDDCVKIEIEESWPKEGTKRKATVWLAKGVGVVKRQYAAGRVDELVSYKIPKP